MEQNGIDSFNETKLKKALKNLETKSNENQRLRIKHAESPAKFAVSETELFAALDEIQGVTTQPELYPVLSSRIDLLISLISHDNTDISAKVIGIVQELTDLDESNEQEQVEELIEILIEKKIVDLIVSNVSRFDRNGKEESQAIINSLDIIENLIEYDSSNAVHGSSALITWMVEKLKENSQFDSIKLPIAELLSIVLMSSDVNKSYLNEAGGIDSLLQQIAFYRRIAPQTGEEHEFLEQVITCLCTALLNCDATRESFIKEEGIDLVVLVLKEKRESIKKSNLKLSVLRIFNHVLTTDKSYDKIVTQSCERFIEILGLRVLFPIFNNPKLVLNEKVKRREYHQFLNEVEEHASAIILALLKNSQNSEHIQRILVKFAESDFEKFLRLLDLHEKYFKIVQTTEGTNDKSSAHYTLRAVDYSILLVSYLTSQFETYDPTSGETFANFIVKTLTHRLQLRHQLVVETRLHIDEMADTKEERESLMMLLEHFELIGKSTNIP